MVNLPRAPIPGITKTGSPTGNDTLIGEDFDDELHGLGGDDTLKGGYGTDKLYGGIGDDELDGESSSYLGISGTNPPNQLYGGPDDDTYIMYYGGSLVIELPNEGIDRVLSSLSTYTLPANVENLQIIDGQHAIGSGLGNRISGNGINNTLQGLGGNDNLTGFGGRDTLEGGAANDFLDGLVFGNGDHDRLVGGPGNDTYALNSSDTIVEFANEGTDTVSTIAASYTLLANFENLNLLQGVTGHGNSVDNVISGNDKNNTLRGFGGKDALNGAGGIDTLWGGDGFDRLNGDAGNDTLRGDGQNDTLIGGDNNDTLRGGNGVDELLGGKDNDILDGGAGLDKLDGGSGFDRADYLLQAGNVRVDLAIGQMFVQGQSGTKSVKNIENVYTGNGNDILRGDSLSNVLSAGTGSDTLRGEPGKDTLYGGAGADTLIGGADSDTLYGHLGADDGVRDIFDYDTTTDSKPGTVRDRIMAFGVNDKIDVSTIDADELSHNGNNAFTFIGSEAFHGQFGELRVLSRVVQADWNGDRRPDLEIYVNKLGLAADDFIL